MLPFMKPEKSSSVVIAKSKPAGGLEDEGMEGEPNHALLSVAEDLIKAVHAKDTHAVAACLEDAFVMLDSPEDEDEGQGFSFGGEE